MINLCIHLPPEIGYETVVKLLNHRYGNLHHLLASYMKEIKALLFVKPGGTSGFRKFYSFVLMCETFSKSTAWNVLETIETLCILVSKLLGSLRNRWNRKLQVVRREPCFETIETLCILVSKLLGSLRNRWNRKLQAVRREPCLSNFSSFVHGETTLVNYPFFQRMLYWSIFRLLKRNTIKKRNMEVLPQKEEKW